MDRLTAWVTLHHARLRLDIIERLRLLEQPNMSTILQGLGAKLGNHFHYLETEAKKLDAKIEGQSASAPATFQRAHEQLDRVGVQLSDVGAQLAAIDAAIPNGAPESPLDQPADSPHYINLIPSSPKE